MLGTMGSAKRVDIPTQTTDSLSINNNNSWVRKAKATMPNLQQSKAYNVYQGTNVSIHNLLQGCKPLYIRLERLPDSVVVKPEPIHRAQQQRKKKTRPFRWKYGVDIRRKKDRVKLQQLRIKRLQKRQSRVNNKIDNADETVALDPISNLSRSNSAVTTLSQSKSSIKLGRKIYGLKQSTDGNNVHGPIAREEKLLETQENKLGLTTKANEEDSRDQDQITRLGLSHEHEPHITKPYDNSQNRAFDTSAEYLTKDFVVLPEKNNHLNRKISLSAYKEPEHLRPVKHGQKRKLSPNKIDAFKEKRGLHRSKKHKCSAIASDFESVSLAEISNIDIVKDETSSFEEKPVRPQKQKNSHPKLVPRKQSLKRSNSRSTAMIVMNRLDSSRSPLVQKWKEKVRCPNSDRGTDKSPMENHVASPRNGELEEQIRLENSADKCPTRTLTNQETSTLPIAHSLANKADVVDRNINLNETVQSKAIPNVNTSRSPEKQSEMIIETIMCDSNEDEDDEEIMEFLSARRRVRPSIESRGSKNSLNVQTNRQIPQSAVNVKDPLANELDTEVSSNRQHEKTPLVVKESRTQSMDNLRPERSLKHTESWITHPITRSKSRAAIESWSLHSNEISSPIRELEADDQIPILTEETPLELPENPIIKENEDQFVNCSMENSENIAEREQNRSNESPLEAVHSDIETVDMIQTESSNRDEHPTGSRKSTLLKSPFVVLTRLEDVIDISEGNVYSSNKIKLNNITFSTKFNGERIRHDSDSYDDIDLHYEDIKAPGQATDLPYIDHRTEAKERTSKKPWQQNGSAITENNEISEQYHVNRIQSTTDSLIAKVTLPLEGQCYEEKVESDDELLSIFEDHEKTIMKSSTCKLSEGILTDANCCNDRSIRNPPICSPENLDEHCKHCNCKEHRRDNQSLKCQNISATYKCVTCKSLFKNAKVLEEHRTSNAFCRSGFRCTICKLSYMTLIELAKHRVNCAERGINKRNTVEQITNEESTSEFLTAKSTIMEVRQLKNKQKKSPIRKSASKPGRSKMPYRVDDLACSVCSIPFATRSALSEHIFRHSTQELQEAYRMAKTKVIPDGRAGNEGNKKSESNESPESGDYETVDTNVLTGGNRDKGLAQVSIPGSIQDIASNDSLIQPAIICSCHRDKAQMPTDKSDLQIEMVLHCKYCEVLFRRRECLEVHYRTSTYCANDRTHGRLARLFCANCELTLNTWVDMRHHLETHAKQNADGTVRFVCNICRIVFVGFGALFYNHWFSHLKDTMFVAGRYNFPRMSIQPIDGTEKLPAGTKPDENYIYVAEHVCSKCKKPFSTRRDLESHTKTCTSCETQNIGEISTSSMTKNTNNRGVTRRQKGSRQSSTSCDVCNLSFSDRAALNNHAVTSHDKRFINIVSPLPSAKQAFMCTQCCETKTTVRALEEHWKTHMSRQQLLEHVGKKTGTQSTQTVAKEPAVVTSSVDDDHDLLNTSTVHINGVTPVNKSQARNDLPVNTVGNNDVSPGNAVVLNVPVESSTNQNICLDNEETSISISSVTSTNTNLVTETNDGSMLRDISSKVQSSTNNSIENQMAKIHEDPSVSVERSRPPNGTMSASVNINTPRIQNEDRTHDNQSSCEHNARTDKDTHDRTGSNTTTTNDGNMLGVTRDHLIGIVIDRCLNQSSESNLEGRGNSHLSKVLESTKRNISSRSLHGRTSSPEIIDIIDEIEVIECIGENTVGNGNGVIQKQQSRNDALANSRRSGLSQFNDIVSRKLDGSDDQSGKVNRTCNGSGLSGRAEFYLWAAKASQISFEEARWMSLSASTSSNDSESAGTKKQGFLRVKDLSELRAVKTHVCSTCDARFESQTSLIQHEQVHMRGVVGKDVQYPKGISAALVLPDSSERSETPASTLPAINTISTVSIEQRQLMAPQPPSYAPPPFIEVITSRSATTETYPPTIVLNNDSIGAWIQSGGQHMPTVNVSSTPLQSTNLLQNNNAGTDLIVQGQSANSFNSDAVNPILMTSTTFTQSQNNLAMQRQPLLTSGGSLVIPESNQRLLESRAGSMGFHVLPPMVVLPASQVSKQQHHVLQHTSSNNYLPISGGNNNPVVTYQNEHLNSWLCTLCHNFRCETMEEFQNHITKHYTGWQNSTVANSSMETTLATKNSMQPILTTITSAPTVPTTTSFTVRQETIRHGLSDSMTNGLDPVIFNHNWTVKETPQGPMLVTPTSNTHLDPTISSYVLNSNRSILQAAPPKSINHNSTFSNTGQIVFRCMICKSALYKNYPPLLNHVMFVHGIKDFASRGIENIVQKSYHCTQCPNTTALFNCEEQFRNHVNTIHPHTCSTCRRSFVSILSLKSHQEHCRIPPSNDRISFGSN